MTPPILVELSDRILTVRFNRPAKKNAISEPMYAALADAIAGAQTDDEVRVVLLAGQSDCFTSGNDLSGPLDGLDGAAGRFVNALITAPKPLIAAPCGLAIGVGLTMLLYCDLVYSGEHTLFRAPFVNLGVCPELGSSYMLPHIMGLQRAGALLLTGEVIDAKTAREYGLVNDVLPNDQAEAFARGKAALIAAQSPSAVRTTKMLMRRWHQTTVNEANQLEMTHLLRLQDGPDAAEAASAFRQKRQPDFSRAP